MEYLCAYCNKPFLPKRTDSLYCSHSCRQYAYVLRKTAATGTIKSLPMVNEIPLQDETPEIIEQPKIQEQQLNLIPVLTDTKLFVKTDEEIPVRTDKNKKEIAKSEPVDDFEQYHSRYLTQLDRLYGEKNIWYDLSKFFDSKDEAGLWVSERYRCLLEVLLTLSEMKRIELDDLKEVCNAFTDVIHSKYYKFLHPSYPYIDEIRNLREQIRSICIKTKGEHLRYRLVRDQKQNLIIARFELSQFIPKAKFSELNFKDK